MQEPHSGVRMILEVDPNVISARVSMRDAQAETPLAEQSLSQVKRHPRLLMLVHNTAMISSCISLASDHHSSHTYNLTHLSSLNAAGEGYGSRS